MKLVQTYIKRFSNLEQKLNSNITITEKFISDGKNLVCSDPDFLNKIQNQVNNLQGLNNIVEGGLKNINNLTSYIGNIQKALNIVQGTIIVLKTTTSLIPTSVPPGVGIPAGVIINASEILRLSQNKVVLYNSVITGVNSLLLNEANKLKTITSKISNILTQYDLLKKQFLQCNKDISKLETELSKLENNNTQLINSLPKNIQNSNNYKGYTFQIIEEQKTNSDIKVNRRYAVAINKNGISEFTSYLTYATNTELLINDLKLKIDQKEN